MMAVNKIQNSLVSFFYHEEIFILYINVRHRKSNSCTCTHVYFQNTYIAYWTTRNRTLWKNFRNVIRYKKNPIEKKIATGKEWNKLLKILSLESNAIFLIFCNCKVHDLGIFILQVCIIWKFRQSKFTCETRSPMTHLSWTTSRLQNKDCITMYVMLVKLKHYTPLYAHT